MITTLEYEEDWEVVVGDCDHPWECVQLIVGQTYELHFTPERAAMIGKVLNHLGTVYGNQGANR